MREIPVLMNGPMVRATMGDRKSETRRPVKVQPTGDGVTHNNDRSIWFGWQHGLTDDGFKCPLGVPGDRLWCRETWRAVMTGWETFVEFKAGGANLEGVSRDNVKPPLDLRFVGRRESAHSERWRPSIHMPRWACRLFLDVVEVRVERLQDIDEDGARREGIGLRLVDEIDKKHRDAFAAALKVSRVAAFAVLWDSIYGVGAFAANPWVWAVRFERVKAGGQ
jgi:hypothetical protein